MRDDVVVVCEPWRMDPLAWIHRSEARAIARELDAPLVAFDGSLPASRSLLRLSDPVMRLVVRDLIVPYCGPGSAALERCYDKYEAHRIVTSAGIDGPQTLLADSSALPAAPFILKPRRGSDSIGVHVVSSVPAGKRSGYYVAQERIVGEEVTVGVFREQTGLPLRIFLPPGTPYSFLRKYFFRPRRDILADERIREVASRAAAALGVDWAARVDLMIEQGTGRICFLECDAAPLVGPASAFAASFAAAGIDRARQLEWLLVSR